MYIYIYTYRYICTHVSMCIQLNMNSLGPEPGPGTRLPELMYFTVCCVSTCGAYIYIYIYIYIHTSVYLDYVRALGMLISYSICY